MPIITGVRPPSGPALTATAVSIDGSNFKNPPIQVTFMLAGSGVPVDATDLAWVSGAEITCTTPALAAGLAEVGVVDSGGSALLEDAYEYIAVLEEPEVAHVATHTTSSGAAEQVAQDGEGTVTASSGAAERETQDSERTVAAASGEAAHVLQAGTAALAASSGALAMEAPAGTATITAASGAKAVEAIAGTATFTVSSGGRETQ